MFRFISAVSVTAAVFTCGAASLLSARDAHAQTYNISTDFNVATNSAANVFQYGQQSAFGGAFTLFTSQLSNAGGNSNFSGWAGTDNELPVAVKHIGASNTTLGGKTFAPGDVFQHSDGDANAVIRFVAPLAGSYTVNANWELRAFNQNSDGVSVGVYRSGVATALFGATLGGGGRGSSAPGAFGSSATLNLLAGESLDFVVNRFGDELSDVTVVSGIITRNVAVVPEAGSAFLLGTAGFAFGSVGLILRRRARKHA